MAGPTTREALNIRIQPELRGLIDRAAELLGKTRTDFVLDASRKAAEEVLMDRALFTVSEEAFQAFLDRLDAAPEPNERLARTMKSRAPWDAA